MSVSSQGTYVQAQQTVPAAPAAPGAIGATLPSATDMQTGVLLPNPETPTCEVGIAPGLANGYLALEDSSQPTASPVPSLVQGSLSLQLANLQTTDLQVRHGQKQERALQHNFLRVNFIAQFIRDMWPA